MDKSDIPSCRGSVIYVVDDDPSVLKALARLLKAAGYEVRPYLLPQEFIAAHDPAIPGCAIVDLRMAKLDGLAVQQFLNSDGHARPIVFLTGNGDVSASVAAMKAGAVDFLTKPVNKDDLLKAVQRAVQLDMTSRQRRQETEAVNVRLAKLTPREREVLSFVIAGKINKQIAANLGTVEKTVKVHRSRMMSKLGVQCVADLVRMTERAGIEPVTPNIAPSVNSTARALWPKLNDNDRRSPQGRYHR